VSVVSGILLHDVIGSPARAGEVLLVPALFDFTPGAEGPVEFHLKDFKPDMPPLPAFSGDWVLDDETLLPYWVRARIPAVFGFRSLSGWDVCRHELLNFPFVAVLWSEAGASLAAIPIVCTEGWSGPGLIFRATDTDPTVKGRVASAFWAALLQAPDQLEAFEEHLFDEEAGWLKVGYAQGQFFICEMDDYDPDDPSGRFDPHLARFPGEVFRCPDCDGSGVEDLFPFTEDCASCGGTGVVTW